jgi:hypothetical protein
MLELGWRRHGCLDWAVKFRRGEDLALAIAEIRQHLGLGDGDDN